MGTKVVIKHGTDPAQLAYEAIKSVFLDEARGRKVLLKPNTGFKGPPETGLCTHPEVIRGLIAFFLEQEASEIYVGDSSIFGVDGWEALKESGIKKVCAETGAICVNLDDFQGVEKKIPEGVIVDKLKFSALVFEVDFIVSVPVIKTHMYTGATLSIKNMKGCLYKREKSKLHRIFKESPDRSKGLTLDYGIADMASALMPHYAVIDGIVCMEGFGPSGGAPRNLDLVIAGKDPVAADLVAVKLMGMDWDAIPHLNLVQERFGKRPETELAIEPLDFMKYSRKFKLVTMQDLNVFYPNITIIEEGACSACSSTIISFLKVHGDKFKHDYRFALASGKDLKESHLTSEHTFLIGNCASSYRDKLPFCKGCPPVPSDILALVHGEKY
jgi:uncharacterized protein (DUF362 family)